MTLFKDLGLAEPLLKAVTEAGYETPTPIQLQSIPPILTGADLLGIAQTGTGKTAAFALPIMHRLAADRRPAPRHGCRVLVLSPTRELASQIGESFRTYGRHLGFSVAVIFGGVSERPQSQALARGVDIVVATPGRLLDHTNQRNLNLSTTEIFVLDEADQMLDLGFFVPIRRVVAQLPKVRQSLFFSATMPPEIEKLTVELLHKPVKVSVTPAATTVERIAQRVIHVEQNKKKSLLVTLLASKAMARTLVFTRTKRGADRVAKHLDGAGITVSAIHGNKSQRQREEALDAFKAGKIRVLVATDIAARGIDVDLVSHVVNYELPEVPEAYVHRIGRTARAGATGEAVAFCDGSERGLLRDIERLTRQVIPSEDRRGDATLTADKAGSASSGEDRPRQGNRGGGNRGAGNRGGGNRGGESRNGAQRFGAPSSNGGGRSHASRGAGAGRDGAGRDRDDRPWSNQPGSDRPRADRPERTEQRGEYRSEHRGERRAASAGYQDRPIDGSAPSRPQPRNDRSRDDGREGQRIARPHTADRAGDRNGGGRPQGARPHGDRNGGSGARPSNGHAPRGAAPGGSPGWRPRPDGERSRDARKPQ